jgi:hypothetical protein
VLTGPRLTGPGWTTDRHYQAGDRALFHTRCGDRRSPLVNGTVATVTAVDHHGSPFAPMVAWPCPSRSSSRGSARTGRRTCPTPGPAPSTAPRAAPGTTPTCWARPRWTPTGATPASPAPATPLTPGTRPRSMTVITAAGSPTGAPPSNRWGGAGPSTGHDHGRGRRPRPIDRRLRAIIDAHHAVLERQPPDRSRELADARRAAATAHEQLADAQRRRPRPAPRSTTSAHGPSEPAGRAERRHLRNAFPHQQAAIDAAGAVARADSRPSGSRRPAPTTASSRPKDGDATPPRPPSTGSTATGRPSPRCSRADQPSRFGVEPLRLAHQRLAGQLAHLDASSPATALSNSACAIPTG